MNIFVRAWVPAFVKMEKSFSKWTKMIAYHFNFTTSPSIFQADFSSPSLVMFLTFFKNQNLTLNITYPVVLNCLETTAPLLSSM